MLPIGPPPKSTQPVSPPVRSTLSFAFAKIVGESDTPAVPKLLLHRCAPELSSRARATSLAPTLVSGPPPRSTVPENERLTRTSPEGKSHAPRPGTSIVLFHAQAPEASNLASSVLSTALVIGPQPRSIVP